MSERTLGKYMKRLLAVKVSRDAIPNGGGFADGLEFLLAPQKVADTSRKALEWCDQAINAIRATPDNPYGQDEEVIAKAILVKLGEPTE